MHQKIDRQERLFLFLLFITALCVRLAFSFFAKDNYFFYANPSSDVAYYQEWAREIAFGNFIGDKAFFGLPLYPYVLSVIFRLSLGNIEVIRFFHLVLGSLNCLFVFVIAKHLFSRRVAVLSSILMCFNFFMIYYDWLMMPVTLIIFLSLVIIFALQNRAHLFLARHWVILGLLIGMTILGDGKFLFFLSIASGWLWFKEPQRRKHTLIMTLSALCVLGLCTLRNKIVSGDWILISAQSGLSFYAGNNPTATGTYSNPQFIRPTHQGQDEDQRIVAQALMNRSMTPGEISKFWNQKALQFIKDHPDQYFKLLLKKLVLFFRETEDAHDMDLLFLREWKYRLDWNALAILFPMALIGFVCSFQKSQREPFIAFLIICQLIVTLMFFLATRHRATILPFLFMFQAEMIFWFIKHLRKVHLVRTALAILFIAVFALALKPTYINAKVIQYNWQAKAGAVFAKRGNLEFAKQSYYRALQYVPGDSTTLYNLGNIYVQEQNWEMAKRTYQKSLKICSYNVDAIFNLAYVYEELGDPDAALALYQKVKKAQPDMPDVYFRMANIHAKQGRCNTALPLYQKLLEMKPILKDHIITYMNTYCTTN